ncbi:CPBP family intramembrane glutamic endopeptidase [Lactobacillus sp. ESL0681]|uniref:CPBP family intramembrane glutamic endopeptidase n=1 Tax=Lactobacillus sp. ESL0681 TaxID=2983211 RepID=UPI0023F736A2|nr:CPBP family intramembrane glutamic endopeptidase [Lactobacillus sp. ESL0681]WEV39819.1 CPBP family intramembrane metalloprotease [Lactobacillus sp. ESL0681]
MNKRHTFVSIVLLILLVPIVMLLFPSILYFIIPSKYYQVCCDALIIVILFISNKQFFNVKLNVISFNHIFTQILLCIPTVAFLLLTKNIKAIFDNKADIFVLITTLFIALAEEILFRGIVLPLSLQYTSYKYFASLLISSVGFAFSHIVNIEHAPVEMVFLQMILVFSAGMLSGALYLTTKNLSLPIVFHFVNDLPVLNNVQSPAIALSSSQLKFMYILVLAIAMICSFISFIQLKLFINKDRIHK